MNQFQQENISPCPSAARKMVGGRYAGKRLLAVCATRRAMFWYTQWITHTYGNTGLRLHFTGGDNRLWSMLKPLSANLVSFRTIFRYMTHLPSQHVHTHQSPYIGRFPKAWLSGTYQWLMYKSDAPASVSTCEVCKDDYQNLNSAPIANAARAVFSATVPAPIMTMRVGGTRLSTASYYPHDRYLYCLRRIVQHLSPCIASYFNWALVWWASAPTLSSMNYSCGNSFFKTRLRSSLVCPIWPRYVWPRFKKIPTFINRGRFYFQMTSAL